MEAAKTRTSGFLLTLGSCTKHWGVVLQIYNVKTNKEKDAKLVDAGQSYDGKLEAKLSDYEEEEDSWKSATGFAETDIPLSEPIPYTSKDIVQFIDAFNNSKYHLVLANCQEFVCELLTHLGMENTWSRMGTFKAVHSGLLPTGAQTCER